MKHSKYKKCHVSQTFEKFKFYNELKNNFWGSFIRH